MAVKLSILFRKKTDLSDDEFNKYWSTGHAELFTGLSCVKSKMTRYDQYHTVPAQTTTLRSMGIPVAPFDGIAEFYFNDMDDLLAVITSREYGQAVPPDLVKFIDVESAQMLVGRVEEKMK